MTGVLPRPRSPRPSDSIRLPVCRSCVPWVARVPLEILQAGVLPRPRASRPCGDSHGDDVRRQRGVRTPRSGNRSVTHCSGGPARRARVSLDRIRRPAICNHRGGRKVRREKARFSRKMADSCPKRASGFLRAWGGTGGRSARTDGTAGSGALGGGDGRSTGRVGTQAGLPRNVRCDFAGDVLPPRGPTGRAGKNLSSRFPRRVSCRGTGARGAKTGN